MRAGAYLAPGVVIMPPAYINTGAHVGEGTMIDSNCLVGSCAQIGARVHISAGAQIGGVLEPIGLRPVVIEDEVVVGGNAGDLRRHPGWSPGGCGPRCEPYRFHAGLRPDQGRDLSGHAGGPAYHSGRSRCGSRVTPSPRRVRPG